MIKTVLLFFSVIHGTPVGPTGQLVATTHDCRAELATVAGINQANRETGLVIHASCEHVDDRR